MRQHRKRAYLKLSHTLTYFDAATCIKTHIHIYLDSSHLHARTHARTNLAQQKNHDITSMTNRLADNAVDLFQRTNGRAQLSSSEDHFLNLI